MLLLDQNLSYRIVLKVVKQFPETRHVTQVGLRDKPDSEIWNYAKDNQFTIVTFDADYFDISLLKGSPPKIIWLRTGNTTSIGVIESLLNNEEKIKDFISGKDNFSDSCLEIL